MRKLLLAAALPFFLLSSSSFGQTPIKGASSTPQAAPERCAATIIHDDKWQNDPAYRIGVQNARLQTESLLQNNLNFVRSGAGILTVPVVVHVIHLGEAVGTGTNVSDAQIQSAINALNDDFRKVAGTAGDGAGVDCEIEFCLAVRDTAGNATSGIIRIDGSSLTAGGDNYGSMGITDNNETAVKALSVWPNTDYYNIWLVSEIDDNGGGSGTQGYAYFPGAGPSIDGAVILHNAFGFDTLGTAGFNLKSYTDMNRTATHEIGHALDLYHTFQGDVNGTTCPTNTSCTTDGDLICDTDPHIRSASNCPTGTNSCTGNPDQDIVRNYMDYSGETCQDEFTQGQKDRMRAALCGPRLSLQSSLACTPVNAVDGGISSIISPSGDACGTSFNPQVNFINFGSTTLTSANINYDIDGGGMQTYNWSGTLTTGQSESVTLNTISTTAGAHTLNVWTSNPNGGTDDDITNDSSSVAINLTTGNAVYINLQTDDYGSETTWFLQDNLGNVILSGGPYTNLVGGITVEADTCLPDGDYDFIINDSFNDGICCANGNGSFDVTDNFGNSVASGGSFGSQDSTRFQLPFGAPPGSDAGISGILYPVDSVCTTDIEGQVELENLGSSTLTSVTINYGVDGSTPNAFMWTGSLAPGDVDTVMLPVLAVAAGAHTFDVNTSMPNGGSDDDPSNDASLSNFTALSANPITLNITTDQYGSETTWEIKDNGGTVVANGGAYGPDLASAGTTLHVEETCLADGCYDLIIYDSFGDGMCCTYGNGGFVVQDSAANTIISGAPTTGYDSTNFCIPLSADDAGISAILEPGNGDIECDLDIDPQVVITNYGSSTLATATIHFGFDGNYGNTFNWTGSLASAESDTVSLAQITTTAGNHSFDAYSTLPNGNADGDNSNDTTTVTFDATIGNPLTLTVTTDQYGSETTWEVRNTSGALQFTGGPYGPDLAGVGTTTHIEEVCVADGCYDLLVYDAFSDGMCCTYGNGGYSLTDSSGLVLASGAMFTDLDSTRWCVPPSGDDAGIVEIIEPAGTECDLSVDGMVVIRNFGTNTLTSANINYGIDGSTPNTFAWTGSLAPSALDTVALPTLAVTAGAHTYDANSSMPNGLTDGDATNDSASTSFTAMVGNALALTIVTDQYGSETTWDVKDGATVVASGGPYGPDLGSVGTTTHNENICLADGCFDLIVYDAFPDGMCCTYGNGSYSLQDTAGVVLASGGTFTDQDSTNFCVPVVAAIPTADFEADFTTIPVGGVVNFTDISSAYPDVLTWSWNFGGGGTPNTSADTNPTITFNTAGMFAVTLTATNSEGSDDTVKTAYITVYDTDGVCDSLTNIDSVQALTTLPLVNGAFAGHSNDSLERFADKMYYAAATNVQGFMVPVETAFSGTGSSTVDFVVYDDNNGLPGSVLGTETVAINSLTAGQFNYVPFSSPVAVNSTFYVGFEISYAAPQDTFIVQINQDRGAGELATAYTYGDLGSGAQWFDFKDISGNFSTSLGITALLSTGTPTAVVSPTNPSTCPGNNITFDASSSSLFSTVSWSFPGGTPGTSTNIIDSTSFASSGSVDVWLYAEGGCGIDSASTTVTLGSGGLSVSTSGSNPACPGNCDGTGLANASGGTAPYTFAWNDPATQTDSLATGLCAGFYTVTVTDAGGCSTSGNVILTDPAAMVCSIATVDPGSAGASDGSVSASATNGTMPYTYNWSTGDATSTVLNLPAGAYTVTITDAAGCTCTTSAVLNDPGCAVSVSTSGSVETCAGDCDGTALATPTGGTMPYTYSWNTGASTANLSGLCPGSYTVTVADAAGCQDIGNITVVGFGTVTIATSVSNPSTPGGSNGFVATAVSGGFGAYTYTWNTGASTDSIGGLSANTYCVTVQDGNGCAADTCEVLFDPGCTLAGSASSTDESCFGSCDGTATLTNSGGTTPYTYGWSNFAAAPNLVSLCAGTYSYTVTDAAGCSINGSLAIAAGDSLGASKSSSNPSVAGGSDGYAVVAVTGGTTPYTYLWNDPLAQSSDSATNLVAGSYCVTVTDLNGCFVTVCDTLIDPPCAISGSISTNDPSTLGGTDGSATAVPSTGAMPYTYSWGANTGFQTGATATGLTSGTYCATITDAAGCVTTACGTLNDPGCSLALTPTSSDPLCNGECTGTADPAASGGTTPYTYAWSNGMTAASLSGLCATSYTVTVSDAAGCTQSNTFVISQPSALIPAATGSNPTSVGGSDGSVSVSMTGGTSPYTYLWNTANTTASVSNLMAGTYCATITDFNGCDTVVCVTLVDAICSVALSASGSNPQCFGYSDGSVAAVPTSGTMPYTYAWSSGSTDSVATGLAAGTYTVSVTDAAGCFGSANATITTSANPITVLANGNDPSYPGASNGTLSATSFGGLGGHSFQWYNGVTSPNQGAQVAGTYCVTVTDVNGCSDSDCITLVDPPCNMVLNTSTTDASCYGGADGTMTVAVSGYYPYTYSWTVGAMDSIATGLPAGTYSVTVTDIGGCTATATDSLDQATPLVGTTSIVDATCGLANGTATVSMTGGTAPYTYDWPSNNYTDTDTNLVGGTYTVTITDANGCIVPVFVPINTTPAPSVALSSTDESCGLQNGSVAATASGATLPYTYLWSDSSTAATANGLTGGTYTVTVTDANGCSATGSSTISSGPVPSVAVIVNDASCGQSNGNSTLGVSGGTTPYFYAWPSGNNQPTETDLSPGTYVYTVTDNLGCVLSDTIEIESPPLPTASVTATDASSCSGSDGTATVAVTGESPFTYVWSTGAAGTMITGLAAGAYEVTVTDGNGCTLVETASVSALGGPVASASATDASCAEGSDGVASVTPAGGLPPYVIQWSTGATSNVITGLSAGTYTVTVTDGTGCLGTSTVTVGEPAGMTITYNVIGENAGQSNGSVAASVSGGATPYTYAWSSGGNGPTEFGLAAGDYTVTITDGNGCPQIDTVTVPILVICPTVTVSTTLSDCDVDNGTASVNVIGGTSPFTYNWSNGATTSATAGLAAGNYSIYVIDNNGCDTTVAFSIFNVGGPSVSTNVIDASCGNNNGTITTSTVFGTAPYSYHWSTGSLATGLTNIGPGTYTVTVTDQLGCSQSVTSVVSTAFTGPDVVVTKINTSCGDSTGLANATVSGGLPPYQFNWSNGGTTASIGGLTSGLYQVTVTDSNGCSDVGSAAVNDIGGGTLSVATTNVSCNGDSNGVATASLANSLAVSYLWSTGGTLMTESGLPPGMYSVTSTDTAGCQAIKTFTISQPQPLILQVSSTDGQCSNNTGSVLATTSGGAGTILFQWSNGVGSAFNNFLGSGTYTVTATDGNGCSATDFATVVVPPALTLSINETDENCSDGTGSLVASASGGTPPLHYTWSNGITNATLSNLSSGTWDLTVSDANNCSITGSGTVDNVGGLVANITGDQQICLGQTVNLAANGGASYLWSTGDPFPQITVQPGLTTTYSVTISDGTGCTEVLTSTVTVNQTPVANLVSTNDTICPGDSVTITATGGLTYSWNTGDTSDAIVVTPVNTTAYVVIAYIGNCSSSPASTTVFMNPLSPIAVASANDNTAYLGSGGTLHFSSAGSVGDTYAWDFNGNGTIDSNDPNASYSYFQVGTYNAILSVTLDGCTVHDTLVIEVKTGVGTNDPESLGRAVSLFPNPTRDVASVSIQLAQPEEITIELYNPLGQLVGTFRPGYTAVANTQIDLSDKANGVYYVKITAGDQTVTKRLARTK